MKKIATLFDEQDKFIYRTVVGFAAKSGRLLVPGDIMWQAEFKLYLYPNKADFIFDIKELSADLKEIAFIDKPLSISRYSVGDKFVSLLTFMGCSPDIELEPQDSSPYCYVELDTRATPRFIAGSNLKKARCPYCKRAVSSPLSCNHCDQALDPSSLNWRKTAFYASSWICIGNIYELEAIPSDYLLNHLHSNTGTVWRGAYIRFNND